MRHAISSIFNAAIRVRNSADVQPGAATCAPSSSMLELNLSQLRLVVGGDSVEPDGLPKGGWKAAGATTV